MTITRKIVVSAVVGLVSLPLIVFAARANAVRYTIASSEVHAGNAYGAGEDVLVAGSVTGDLTAAGGAVTITGSVTDDLLAAAGQIQALGRIGGDMRVATGDLLVGSAVGGDLVAAGGQLYTASGSTVGGNVFLAGGDVTLDGAVTGDVRISAGTVLLNGPVHGSVIVRSGKLTVGDHAVIDGSLRFTGPAAPIIATNAVIAGGLNYVRDDFGGREFGMFASGLGALAAMVWLLANVLIAALLFGFFKKKVTEFAHAAVEQFWPHLGRGFGWLILWPIISVIALVTVLGAPIGFFGLLSLGVLATISCALGGIVFGTLLMRFVFRRTGHQPTMATAIWGTVALRLVSFIPVIGWLICFAMFCVSFGVIVRAAHHQFWHSRG